MFQGDSRVSETFKAISWDFRDTLKSFRKVLEAFRGSQGVKMGYSDVSGDFKGFLKRFTSFMDIHYVSDAF